MKYYNCIVGLFSCCLGKFVPVVIIIHAVLVKFTGLLTVEVCGTFSYHCSLDG